MAQLFVMFLLLALLSLIVGLIRPKVFRKLLGKRTNRKTVAILFGGLSIIFFIIIGIISPSVPEKTDVTNKTPATVTPDTSKAPVKPSSTPVVDPLTEIPRIALSYDKNFDVSLYKADDSGEFATSANSPWDIYINSQVNTYNSCSGAKQQIFDIMKALYTNNDVKSHIARVKISLSNQAQASLGATDGNSISTATWNSSGPTNHAKALAASGSSENTKLAVDRRTYWDPINSSCTSN